MKVVKKILFKYENESLQAWETRVNEFFQTMSEEMEKYNLDPDKNLKHCSIGMDDQIISATYMYVIPGNKENESKKLGFK